MMYRLVAVLLAAWAWAAAAQTTQPAPAEWDRVVQQMAKALVRENGAQDCKASLSVDAAIRGFDASARQVEDLAAHTGGATALLARAYLFPGGCIAGDVGDAVQRSQVSDDLKKTLVPPEGDATTKANSTATRWVQNALAANDGDAIAVLVMFTANATDSNSPDGQILFVLLKGRKESSGSYLVTQIVYGDPQQAAITSAR